MTKLVNRIKTNVTEGMSEELVDGLCESLLDSDTAIVVRLDRQGRITLFNHGAEEVSGHERKEVLGESMFSLLIPRGRRTAARRAYKEYVDGDSSSRFHEEWEDKSGLLRHIKWLYTKKEESNGKIKGTISIGTDLTEQKIAEQELLKEKSFTDAVMDCLPGFFGVFDAEGNRLRWNERALEASGFTVKEMGKMKIPDFFSPEDLPLITEAAEEIVATGESSQPIVFAETRTKDGYTPIAYKNSRVVFDGEPYLVSIGTDVDEFVEAEESFGGRIKRYRQMVEDAPIGFLMADTSGKIVLANRAFVELLGSPSPEATMKINMLTFPNLVKSGISGDLAKVIKENKTQTFERPYVTKWGLHVHLRYKMHPLQNAEGEVAWILSTFDDVTEIRNAQIAAVEAEEALRRLNEELAQRIEERTAELLASNKELEAFSYSVSHDLSAPLRRIAGFCKAIMEDYSDNLDEPIMKYFDRITAGTVHMRNLIDDMLRLSKITTGEMQRTDINLTTIGESIIAGLREKNPDRQVQTIIEAGMSARGDSSLLHQVFENLLSNAWKFTVNQSAPRIEIGSTRESGKTVFFVRDNGAGFDMTLVGDLFQPFKRLHRSDEFEGSGIGLAIVKRIIERHGGRTWAEAEPGRGATIFFTL